MGVPITRVSGSDSPGMWALLYAGPDEWVLVSGVVPEALSDGLAAVFPASGYARAIELARIVQDSIEEHGRLATLRDCGDGVRGRFRTDAAARFFGRLARRDRER
jgi:hypothetical protein